jgi:hypothetical protein
MLRFNDTAQSDLIGWVTSLIVAAILLIMFFLYILPALLNAAPKS